MVGNFKSLKGLLTFVFSLDLDLDSYLQSGWSAGLVVGAIAGYYTMSFYINLACFICCLLEKKKIFLGLADLL
jgi:hypothetical protein